MVKSAKSQSQSQVDEEDDADGYDSSSYRGNEIAGEALKADGKSGSEQRVGMPRSKHSETEQRRRSKINERFQILRDLIPQNDQKRDKASFLLEVIEYIQFLQEKLRMYEGSYEAWGNEPTKLIPWKNHHAAAESLVDHSHIMKNGSVHENNVMLTNAQNSMESDLGTASIYQALDHTPGSTTPAAHFNVQAQANAFSATGRAGMSAHSLQESVSDAENMAYHLQSQMWQTRPCISDCTAPNSTVNRQEELMSETGLVSTSSAYSQGVLNTLRQALKSSGVDLSQTSISVQIDVGKRTNCEATFGASNSKDHDNQYLTNQLLEQTGGGSFVGESQQAQAQKRLRTGKR